MRKPAFCICENKGADQLLCNCEADHAFVFATRIVQFLYSLNLEFPASNYILCLYSLLCVGPVWKPHCLFSHDTDQMLREKIHLHIVTCSINGDVIFCGYLFVKIHLYKNHLKVETDFGTKQIAI